MSTLREAASAADLEAYVGVWNTITPNEPATVEEVSARREREPRRLHLIAERSGSVVACGFAGPSDSIGRGFVAPRVLPAARRTGLGSALLWALCDHLTALGFELASAHVDALDAGAVAFAEHFGFEEVGRQVEQVKTVGREKASSLPDDFELITIAERPSLLRQAHELAREGYADFATPFTVTVPLEDWLRDEATIPEGSFVALAGDEIVGYAGLCRLPGGGGGVEDGLAVVRRDWRRRGVALALKRAKLAFASSNGIGEIVTWTQTGNEAMRALNERLGYVYRDVSITVTAPLPLRRH